jgi:hypothetical protein
MFEVNVLALCVCTREAHDMRRGEERARQTYSRYKAPEPEQPT